MEKLICSSCCAPMVPTQAQAFLTCEYCGTSMENPFYDAAAAAAAAEAAKPSLEEICLSSLQEMGAAQNLADLDPDCFGNPINGIDAARMGLSISDAHQVYLLYSHTFLFVAFSDGLALTDGGLYYKCEDGAGSLSWEAFITGSIACQDRTSAQDGTLKIGSSVSLPVKSEKDSRLARFLVDFHNHVYHLHTGDAAPAAWRVSEPGSSPVAEQKDPSLLGTVLPVVGALLGTSSRGKTVIQRTTSMHPTSRPTIRQDRRNQVQPPRPLHSQPHHRRPGTTPLKPAEIKRISEQLKPGSLGGLTRPAGKPSRPTVNPSRPGSMGRPGMTGGMGKPGMGGPGRPGGQRGSGSSGKGRR